MQNPDDETAETLKILLMIYILQYLKDPKLWELWYIPYYGLLWLMQDLYHEPYYTRTALKRARCPYGAVAVNEGNGRCPSGAGAEILSGIGAGSLSYLHTVNMTSLETLIVHIIDYIM